MRLEDFVAYELRVWCALVDGDQDLDRSMLSEDFLGVYPTGFASRSQHVEQLADGPTVARFSVSQARLTVVGRDDVLLSYRADYTPMAPNGDEGEPAAMYVTSLWSRRQERWVNTFSQDTPAEDA